MRASVCMDRYVYVLRMKKNFTVAAFVDAIYGSLAYVLHIRMISARTITSVAPRQRRNGKTMRS